MLKEFAKEQFSRFVAEPGFRYVVRQDDESNHRSIRYRLGLEAFNWLKKSNPEALSINDLGVEEILKFFSPLLVANIPSRYDLVDPNSDFRVKKGEPVLKMHLKGFSQDESSFAQVKGALAVTAWYLKRHAIDSKYIVGISHEGIIRPTKRYGFTVAELEVPKRVRDNIQRGYEDTERGMRGVPMGRVLTCYQRTDEFVGRFLSKSYALLND